MNLTQLADLKMHSKNPQITELNLIARQNKRGKPLVSRNLTWPENIEVGRWIEWEVNITKMGKVSGWRTKKGRIVAVDKRYAVVDLGKYRETIALVDFYTGQVRLK